MKKTGKKKRDKVKYPALTKKYNSRVRQTFIDQDYLHQLSEDELEWLNRFMAEENSAHFENDGQDFNNTKEERKKIYDRNNARNRDLYGLTEGKVAKDKLLNLELNAGLVENELSRNTKKDTIEDSIIDVIDLMSEELKNTNGSGENRD